MAGEPAPVAVGVSLQQVRLGAFSGTGAAVRLPAPEDTVRGVPPLVVAEPHSELEVSRVLSLANDSKMQVAPRGGGTKLDWGNPPAGLDMILSTTRLDRIIEHAWADLVVIVQAGVTVGRLQTALAEHGQRLAIDPLWPDRATIGGILSTNDSGALRLRFGALRDLVIGVTLALPDGTLAKSGGKVVKNVAGYDLPKLATGALGTLGVITQAAFRLHPLPHASRTLTFRATSLADANRLILAMQDSPLAHTSLQARIAHDAQPAVDIRFEGTAAGIEAQCATAAKLAANAVEAEESADVWLARQALWAPPDSAAIAKFSVLPARIAAACEAIERAANQGGIQWKIAVQGTGLGWMRLESSRPERLQAALSTLRAEFEAEAGSLFVARCPAAATPLDAWGSVGDAYPTMRRMKKLFDPWGILNRGRFVGGM